MKNTVRINFEFPKKHHPYLKMVCAQKGISIKQFASELLIKEIEEYEDVLLAKKAQDRLKELDEGENISFDDACKLAGWQDEEETSD